MADAPPTLDTSAWSPRQRDLALKVIQKCRRAVGHSGLAAENEMALDDVLVWSRRRIEEGRADA